MGIGWGKPVSPRAGLHPFIARPARRKSEENRTAPSRFPNGSLSLQKTGSIDKRGAGGGLQKEHASFFIELAWFPSSSRARKRREGGGWEGVGWRVFVRFKNEITICQVVVLRGRNHADGTDGERRGPSVSWQETRAAGIIAYRRPFCWLRPRIGRGGILFLPDRPIDASRHRYPSVTVRMGLAFSPFARPACLESPRSNLSYPPSFVVNPLSSGAFAPPNIFVHSFSSSFLSFLPQFFEHAHSSRESGQRFDPKGFLSGVAFEYGIHLRRTNSCFRISGWEILLKIFYARVLFRREQVFGDRQTFSGINHRHKLDELVELSSLLRRVIFQDGKNRNSEDEGIFGGEETWTYRGRNSNDPSNAAADVPQTRIVRGIRRPVLQKVSQLYIKTIKREAGPADSHPVQGWARLRAPILCPSIVNSETDPTPSIIK